MIKTNITDTNDVLSNVDEFNQDDNINNSTSKNRNAEDVSQIFCGCEGQDLIYPVVYLLLKDETVKGIDIENGYNTAEFKAETIFGLNNIEKIEQTSVAIPDDSGYEAVVAITEDETAYEIRKK